MSAPSTKLSLAAIRSLFDWLATGGVLPFNPASAVRGPKHSVRTGKTPVLDPREARELLDSIVVSTPIGLRDRALIALMVYSFARFGAAVKTKVEDVFVRNRRLWVRLHEIGGKRHDMPCHNSLEDLPPCLHRWLRPRRRSQEAVVPHDRTRHGPVDPTPLPSDNAHQMVGRCAAAAGIMTRIGNHSFRAKGITAYLKNGGTIEKAAIMANHASTRTTQLYD